MSLGKLLTTGKSLVGLSQSGSRYQLQKGALPKFESAKNPFAKMQAEPAEREPQLPRLSPAEAVDSKESPRLSALGALIVDREASVAANQNAHPAEPAKVAAPVDSWLKKIN